MGGKPQACTGPGACGCAAPVLAATDPLGPAAQCKASPTSLPSCQRGQNLPPAPVRAQDVLRRLPHHAGRQHPDQSPRGGQHPPEAAGERGWDHHLRHTFTTTSLLVDLQGPFQPLPFYDSMSCCPQAPTGIVRWGLDLQGLIFSSFENP